MKVFNAFKRSASLRHASAYAPGMYGPLWSVCLSLGSRAAAGLVRAGRRAVPEAHGLGALLCDGDDRRLALREIHIGLVRRPRVLPMRRPRDRFGGG